MSQVTADKNFRDFNANFKDFFDIHTISTTVLVKNVSLSLMPSTTSILKIERNNNSAGDVDQQSRKRRASGDGASDQHISSPAIIRVELMRAYWEVRNKYEQKMIARDGLVRVYLIVCQFKANLSISKFKKKISCDFLISLSISAASFSEIMIKFL